MIDIVFESESIHSYIHSLIYSFIHLFVQAASTARKIVYACSRLLGIFFSYRMKPDIMSLSVECKRLSFRLNRGWNCTFGVNDIEIGWNGSIGSDSFFSGLKYDIMLLWWITENREHMKIEQGYSCMHVDVDKRTNRKGTET